MIDVDAIFPNLSDADLERLNAAAEMQHFGEGGVLLEEGKVSGSIYIVGEGLVTVTKSMGASEIVVAELTAGDVVGEISFIDGGPVSATVTATTEVDVLRIPKESIQAIADASPEFGMRLYRSLATALSLRLRQMTDQYMVSVP